MDRGARQATVHGVAQSRTRLKRLSSHASLFDIRVGSAVNNLPARKKTQEMWVRSLVREDPLEEEMATHFSTLA